MAIGDVTFANRFKYNLINDYLASVTLKICLVHGVSVDPDTESCDATFRTANECAGTGYTAGGESIAGGSLSITEDDTNDKGNLDITANVTWSSLELTTPADATPDYAIIYDTVDDDVMCWIELGKVTNGGDYTVQFNASGLFDLTQA